MADSPFQRVQRFRIQPCILHPVVVHGSSDYAPQSEVTSFWLTVGDANGHHADMPPIQSGSGTRGTSCWPNQKSVSLPRHRSAVVANCTGDVSYAIQNQLRNRVTVVRELVGHGIGQKPPSGLKFRTTVSVARVEAANRTYTQPMVNLGTKSDQEKDG
jgi:hypothetical protein